MQMELTCKANELQDKEAIIVELQTSIAQMTQPRSTHKLSEEETQCSFNEEEH